MKSVLWNTLQEVSAWVRRLWKTVSHGLARDTFQHQPLQKGLRGYGGGSSCGNGSGGDPSFFMGGGKACMMCAGTADFGGMRGEGQRQEVYPHVEHEGELCEMAWLRAGL